MLRKQFFGFAASSFRLALWVRAIFFWGGCRSRIGTHSLKTTFEISTLWKDARLMAGPYRLPGRQRWREMGPSLEAGEKDVFYLASCWWKKSSTSRKFLLVYTFGVLYIWRIFSIKNDLFFSQNWCHLRKSSQLLHKSLRLVEICQ